jgi:NTP pyrophosphatase (non-canonical NTP hydrolase)
MIITKRTNLKNHLKDLNSNMTQVIDTNKYIEFVRQTTSPASTDYAQLLARMTELEATHDADVPRLLTAALGMSAEAGEFTEVVKKIFLQGKPYNEENVFHMKRELGDLCWYLAQACMALDTNFEEVLQMNYEKLSARYPEGSFDVYRSENRVEGDL